MKDLFNHRVVLCVLATVTLLSSSGCRSKLHAPSRRPTPTQLEAAASGTPAPADENSCRAYVQRFYDWRVSLLIVTFCSDSLSGTRAAQDAIDQQEEQCRTASAYRNAEKLNLDQVFSPRLLHYVQRESAVESKRHDAGLDFDPYLNTQDPSPKFVVESVSVNGSRCDAVVHGYDHGARREEVMPELSKSNGGWMIENFHYKFDDDDGKPASNDDLIHMIRQYIGEVKRPAH